MISRLITKSGLYRFAFAIITIGFLVTLNAELASAQELASNLDTRLANWDSDIRLVSGCGCDSACSGSCVTTCGCRSACNGSCSKSCQSRGTLLQWSYGTSFSGGPDLDEPLVTDRPDFTEASSTVGLGVAQLEFGYTYVFDDDGTVSTKSHSYPETLLRYGIFAD